MVAPSNKATFLESLKSLSWSIYKINKTNNWLLKTLKIKIISKIRNSTKKGNIINEELDAEMLAPIIIFIVDDVNISYFV